MKIAKAIGLALALSAVSMSSMAQEANFYWRKGPFLIPIAVSLKVVANMPATVVAGQSYSFSLSSSGSSGEVSFSGVSLPPFISVASDGTVSLDPALGDEGNYSGIKFVASDSKGSATTGALTLRVDPADVPSDFRMPASASGVTTDRSLVFDGDLATGAALSANGDAVVLSYDAAITAKGAKVAVSGSGVYAVEAMVGSSWKTLAQGSGGDDRDLQASDGKYATASQWRIRKVSGSALTVQEFRPGFAPANPVPVFDIAAGPVTMPGGNARLTASSPSDFYSSAAVVVTLAPGTVLPEGVSFSADGTLSVAADADLPDGTFTFDAVATDGSGFKSTRSYSVISDAPLASTIMAKSFSNDGVQADYRAFYDGSTATASNVAVGKAMVVDFGEMVEFNSVYLAFAAGGALKVEYLTNGQWYEIGAASNASAFAGDLTLSATTVARRVRIVSVGTSALQLAEARFGNGPSHAAPVINLSNTVTLSAQATVIHLRDATTVAAEYANIAGAPTYEFATASESVPPGTVLGPDGTLTLPSANDVSGTDWQFNVKVTDGAGFTTTKLVKAVMPTPDAATVLPTSMKLDTTDKTSGIRGLYDESAPLDLSGNQSLFVTYDRDVSVGSLYAYTGATNGGQLFYKLPNGQFTVVPGSAFTRYKNTPTNFTPVTAREFRVDFSNSGNNQLSGMRIGGGSNPKPIFQSPGTITLGATPQTINLSATTVASYGKPAAGTVNWKLSAIGGNGGLTGVSITTAGVLTLPAAPAGTTTTWTVRVDATDSNGWSALSLPVSLKK